MRRFVTAILAAIVLLAIPSAVSAQDFSRRTIGGTVLDENGETMPGAMVATSDGRSGVLTDEKGNFTLSVKTTDKTVSISMLGYNVQVVDIVGKETIRVVMVPDADNTLNEVVVIGYGEVKKADLTGAVSNVKVADVQEAAGLSVGQALQGRIAGVDIMTTSGDPSEGTSIRIRGTRSITASNEPLIIVDGVMDVVKDLSLLNPDDIASISVLKDASATAIYGSQGANGVIMVTTKSATTSRPRIIISAEAGVSHLARKLDVMDGTEFSRYYNDIRYFNAGQNSGEPLRLDPSAPLGNTDWLGEITRIAPYQNYNLSIGGKEGKLNYYFSLGYMDNQGIIKDSWERRVTARLNVDYQLFKWLKFSYKGSYTFRRDSPNKANIGGTNFHNGAIYLSPLIGPYDEINPLYENGTRIDTPLTSLERREYYYDRHDTFHSGILEIKPAKGLTIKSTNTFKPYQRHDYGLWPNTLSSRLDEQGSRAYIYDSNNMRLLSDNTVSWKKDFRGGHHFDAMGGFSVNYVTANTLSVNANGLVSDDTKWYNVNAIGSKENYTVNSSRTSIVKQSFLGRVNYNFNGRYYLTITGRFDGSSNFAANHKWGFFPSAAFKWAAGRERFVQRAKWLDDLSIRASYGSTGNDAIGAYTSLESYNTNTNAYVFDGTQPLAAYIVRLHNPDLTWEKTHMFNIGADMAFLGNRINFTAEAYASVTTDLLLSVQTAQVTGYTSRYQNLGRTSNKGFELTLETRNIQTKNFGWTTTLTMSHNSQMVEDIGHEEYVSALKSAGNNSYMMYGYKKGYPLNALWGFQYAGPWKSSEEIERNKYTHAYASVNPASPGIARYVDVNHDGVISQDDLLYLGQSDPWLYGGLQNTFHWKDWKLSLFLSYSLGGKIYNYSESVMAGGMWGNQYRYMLDAWHPVRNPESDYPRAGADDVYPPSTFMVHDASYLRLKSLVLSKTFNFRSQRVFKNLVVTLKGDNLFLITGYNGFDPDVSTESDGSVMRRVDMGAYPRSRKITLGVKLTY